MAKKPDPTDQFFGKLIGGMADGSIRLESIRFNVCGKCKEGTMTSSPTPHWMNRFICDKCGHKASR